MVSKTWKFKKIIILFVLAFFIFLSSVVIKPIRYFWLQQVGKTLLYEDQLPEISDGVIVLGGDVIFRTKKAASLIKNGLTKTVFLATIENPDLVKEGFCSAETDAMKKKLVSLNVKEKDIVVIPSNKPVSSTHEEAQAFSSYFKDQLQKPKNIVVVTSWFHTRRARWEFLRAFKGTEIKILVISAEEKSTQQNWWKSEIGFLSVYVEYLKWTYHLTKYYFG